MADLILSDKYKAFLRCTAPVEFLEGTTAAGKTTVGLFKFMLRVAESRQRLHVLAGPDPAVVRRGLVSHAAHQSAEGHFFLRAVRLDEKEVGLDGEISRTEHLERE